MGDTSVMARRLEKTGVRHRDVRRGVIMLRIYFGECEDALYGPIWFKYNYDPSWFKDELVQAVVREIDHTEYIDDSVFDSPVLGKSRLRDCRVESKP